jgi:hypothetical protein
LTRLDFAVHHVPMTKIAPKVKFEIVPTKTGHGWRVLVQKPGQIQYICGFETETDADNWIRSESSGWLKALQAKL